ncbi:MAG TPA: YitT family protein, partial [Bacteroidia bacterium]|nr:YitT family protein [Bacteroidia bacterium]
VQEFKRLVKKWVKDIFLITIGVGSASLGLEGFLLPNSFIDGGATGISLLLSEVSGLSLGVLIVAINIPFIFMAFKVVSRDFALKSAISISALAIVVSTVHFPVITHDSLLVAIFGGFFLGAGIGFSVRGGAVLDGTEVLAIYLSRKLGSTIGDIIIGLNVLIFSAAAYLLSMETAMYAMVTYLVASKTLDYIVDGIDEYTGVTIISVHSNEIRLMIVREMGRGVTVYKGKGGYGRHGETSEIDILYTVITRLELNNLKSEIQRIDPQAFVVMSSVRDTRGGMIKKRPLDH